MTSFIFTSRVHYIAIMSLRNCIRSACGYIDMGVRNMRMHALAPPTRRHTPYTRPRPRITIDLVPIYHAHTEDTGPWVYVQQRETRNNYRYIACAICKERVTSLYTIFLERWPAALPRFSWNADLLSFLYNRYISFLINFSFTCYYVMV